LPPNYDGNKSWSDLTTFPYINEYLGGDNCGKNTPAFPAWGRWCQQDASAHQFGDDLSTNITLQHLRAAKVDPQNRPFFIAVGYHRYDWDLPESCGCLRSFVPRSLLVRFGWYTQSVVARPHLPWAVPKEYYDLYPAAAEIAAPTHPEVPKGMYPMAWHAIPGPGFPTQWNVSLPGNSSRANRRAYYAAVSFLDHQVGIVLAELQQLGFANNTLVVFHSDHVSLNP